MEQNKENDLNILEFYIESGVDESYNDNPFNFFNLNNITPKKNIENVFEENFKKENQLISISQIHKMATEICESVNDFDELCKQILNFEHCPLKSKSISTIIGKGTKENPKLLVLTEIPNSEEDKSGVAYSGDTGILLNKILSAIGMDLNIDTYAMPVMFYRPAGGRSPTSEEIDTVKPFIFKAVDILKPKIILTMGSLSTSLMLDCNETIVALRGKWKEFKTIPLMPTFSLQYILNAGKQGIKEVRQKAWEDVQEVQRKLSNI